MREATWFSLFIYLHVHVLCGSTWWQPWPCSGWWMWEGVETTSHYTLHLFLSTSASQCWHFCLYWNPKYPMEDGSSKTPFQVWLSWAPCYSWSSQTPLSCKDTTTCLHLSVETTFNFKKQIKYHFLLKTSSLHKRIIVFKYSQRILYINSKSVWNILLRNIVIYCRSVFPSWDINLFIFVPQISPSKLRYLILVYRIEWKYVYTIVCLITVNYF